MSNLEEIYDSMIDRQVQLASGDVGNVTVVTWKPCVICFL